MGARLEGAEEFRKLLESLGRDCQGVQQQLVDDMANACLATAIKNTPVGDYTKDLFVDTQNKRIRYVSFKKSGGDRVTFRVRNIKHGGTMRRGWHINGGQFVRQKQKARAEVVNNIPYAGFVNDGHRVVNKQGATVGYVMGRFMLEKGIKSAERIRDRRYLELMEEAKRKHGL